VLVVSLGSGVFTILKSLRPTFATFALLESREVPEASSRNRVGNERLPLQLQVRQRFLMWRPQLSQRRRSSWLSTGFRCVRFLNTIGVMVR
jgi:hypothetical protein